MVHVRAARTSPIGAESVFVRFQCFADRDIVHFYLAGGSPIGARSVFNRPEARRSVQGTFPAENGHCTNRRASSQRKMDTAPIGEPPASGKWTLHRSASLQPAENGHCTDRRASSQRKMDAAPIGEPPASGKMDTAPIGEPPASGKWTLHRSARVWRGIVHCTDRRGYKPDLELARRPRFQSGSDNLPVVSRWWRIECPERRSRIGRRRKHGEPSLKLFVAFLHGYDLADGPQSEAIRGFLEPFDLWLRNQIKVRGAEAWWSAIGRLESSDEGAFDRFQRWIEKFVETTNLEAVDSIINRAECRLAAGWRKAPGRASWILPPALCPRRQFVLPERWVRPPPD